MLETEQKLKDEVFLSEVFIEIDSSLGKESTVIIKTFDHFTTAPVIGFEKRGKDWKYFLGLIESNFLGRGSQIGAFYLQDVNKKEFFIEYNNKSFFKKLQLTTKIAKTSNGNAWRFIVERPLFSKKDRWAFKTKFIRDAKTEFYYRTPETRQEIKIRQNKGELGFVFSYPNILIDTLSLGVTTSFQTPFLLRSSIFNLNLEFLNRQKQQSKTTQTFNPIYNNIYSIDSNNLADSINYFRPETRINRFLGVSLEFNQYQYKKVLNYKITKWEENIKDGFKLKQSIWKNFKNLGASNNDWWLKHEFQLLKAFHRKLIFNETSLSYFLNPNETHINRGFFYSYSESQLSLNNTSTFFLSLEWQSLLYSPLDYQLTLGNENNFEGFPNHYFAGKHKTVFTLEKRFFTTSEILGNRIIFSPFIKIGDAFNKISNLKINNLKSSIGAYLRLFNTNSIIKNSNYLIISIPINEQYRPNDNVLENINISFFTKRAF